MAFTDVLSQPPYPGAKPEEVAEIHIVGRVFSDWETVWVQHRWMDAWPIFRFTAAERFDPKNPPQLWKTLQIIPTDQCEIILAGQLAITGIVTVRQTAYDANSHAVSIQGMGYVWLTWRGSILDEKQEYVDMTYVEIATKVLAPFKMVPKVVGTISSLKFKKVNNETGESVFQFLERIGRTRKVVLGADHLGNILLIGDHESDVVDELTEGVNIKSMQCVIKIEDQYDPYVARGQGPRSNEGSPADAAHQEAFVDGQLGKYSPLLVSMDHPVWTKAEVDLRAKTEATWGDGTIVEATVVVYGWLTQAGVLWIQCVGKSVTLNAPMTTLVGQKLAIRSATCTQDSQSGTQTTLDLVAGWLLNDKGIVQGVSEPGDAQSTPDQPAVTGDPRQIKSTRAQ